MLFSLVEDFYTRSQCYSRVAAHALGGTLGASDGLLELQRQSGVRLEAVSLSVWFFLSARLSVCGHYWTY